MATDQRREARAIGATAGASSMPVVLIIAAMIVGMAALLPLVQSSGATTTGGNIRRLEQERVDWQARLQEQEIRVAELGSLTRIEHEARTRLKMVVPTEVHYIRVDAPAPAPHRLPSRYLPEQPGRTDAGSSLWEDAFGWLPIP